MIIKKYSITQYNFYKILPKTSTYIIKLVRYYFFNIQ